MNILEKKSPLFKDVYIEKISKELSEKIITPVTYKNAIKILNCLMSKELFQNKIADIDGIPMQCFFNDFILNHSITTYNVYFNAVKRIFKYACDKNYIKNNIMDNIIRTNNKAKSDDKSLSIKDQRLLTNYCLSSFIKEEKYKHVILLQLYTGMLPSEVIALDYDDINIDNKSIYIHQYLITGKDGEQIIIKYNVYDSKCRTVYFPDFLIESIKELINNYFNSKRLIENQNKLSKDFKNKLFLKYCIHDKVLSTAINTKPLIEYNSVLISIRKIMSILELDVKTINSLTFRVTYVTRLVEAEIPLFIIQKFLGFKSIKGICMFYRKLEISKVVRFDDDLSEEYLRSLDIL